MHEIKAPSATRMRLPLADSLMPFGSLSNESENASERIGVDCCDVEATVSASRIGLGGSGMPATASESVENVNANGNESWSGGAHLLHRHSDCLFHHCSLGPTQQKSFHRSVSCTPIRHQHDALTSRMRTRSPESSVLSNLWIARSMSSCVAKDAPPLPRRSTSA